MLCRTSISSPVSLLVLCIFSLVNFHVLVDIHTFYFLSALNLFVCAPPCFLLYATDSVSVIHFPVFGCFKPVSRGIVAFYFCFSRAQILHIVMQMWCVGCVCICLQLTSPVDGIVVVQRLLISSFVHLNVVFSIFCWWLWTGFSFTHLVRHTLLLPCRRPVRRGDGQLRAGEYVADRPGVLVCLRVRRLNLSRTISSYKCSMCVRFILIMMIVGIKVIIMAHNNAP